MDTRLIALIKIHVTRRDVADGGHRRRVRISLLASWPVLMQRNSEILFRKERAAFLMYL